MLLEIGGISRAAVVLGSTWLVSAIIISGVLIMVLAANTLYYFAPRLPLNVIYALLLLSCTGLCFFNPSHFAAMEPASRAAWLGAVLTLPLLFSGSIFIRSYSAAPHKGEALGSNLFGALVGSCLQAISFATGIRSLQLLVVTLYALAYIFWRRSQAHELVR